MAIGIAVALGGSSLQLPRMVQSLKAFGVDEVAVADATGNPATRAIFDPIKDRISAYFFEPDKGQSDGLNKAFAALQSPIVGWLNDDDFLVAGGAERVEAAIARADVAYAETLFFDVASWALGYHPHVVASPEMLIGGATISQPSCFFRRQLFEDLNGLDMDLHYIMDWDLWLRMRAAGAKFNYFPELMSGVTLDRAAKTAQVRLRRLQELLARHRRNGTPFIPACIRATRQMAAGVIWKFANKESPPFPYFDAWQRRGGGERAPNLSNADGLALLHVNERAVDSLDVHWRDNAPVSTLKLHSAQEPFELFRIKPPRSMGQIRAIEFRRSAAD